MNDTQPQDEKKDSILKSLAIAGFIGIVIFIAWLSVQLVGVVPGAFSSLASLAEGLYPRQGPALDAGNKTSLTVTSNTTLVNAGESVELAWDTADKPGSYFFSYKCTEGIAIDIMEDDNLQSVACGTKYDLGGADSLSLSIDSEKARYADVDYTISFIGAGETESSLGGGASLTIINNEIFDVLVNTTPDEELALVPEMSEPVEETAFETPIESAPVVEEPVVETSPVVETPVETAPVAETPVPTYEQDYTYTIPTSDPNGQTDLATKYINSGTIVVDTFFPGQIMQNESGAIQFEVKNFGTKTSGTWSFSVAMPDESAYVSSLQTPLKPNERAVLTIGFPTTNVANHEFIVIVSESSDQNILNNSFSQNVSFLK